jgi:hypothetical protein
MNHWSSLNLGNILRDQCSSLNLGNTLRNQCGHLNLGNTLRNQCGSIILGNNLMYRVRRWDRFWDQHSHWGNTMMCRLR